MSSSCHISLQIDHQQPERRHLPRLRLKLPSLVAAPRASFKWKFKVLTLCVANPRAGWDCRKRCRNPLLESRLVHQDDETHDVVQCM